MTVPNQRRRDPVSYARGWEVAAAVPAAAVFAVGFTALLGMGAASRLFGRGWVWPRGTNTIGAVLAGLFSGVGRLREISWWRLPIAAHAQWVIQPRYLLQDVAVVANRAQTRPIGGPL